MRDLKIPGVNTEISVISLRDAAEKKDDVDIATTSRHSRVLRDSSWNGIVQGVLRDKESLHSLFTQLKKIFITSDIKNMYNNKNE